MADTVFAPKYAQAFAQVVAWHHLDAQRAQQQMHEFAALLAESRPLREVLSDPSVAADQKLAVLDAIVEKLGFLREVRNFLAIIMDHHRLESLNEILTEVAHVSDDRSGVAEAEVTTARDLSEEDRHALESEVGRLAGSRVRVTWSQNAELLGGAVIRIGSTIYDGSVRAQLEQLRQSLVAA